ncbi:PadR family transcriptional regulator [Streptacidiphilus sp. PB12-B1b]|uniref:PadR family transcriptional regulator n=1 Tax=Streptacidiphilus sp. PB12-B1b TaxID=2705012 RepID=UPI0015FD8C89|nr:helix-turn-helix transcriptional regulator [Streptacidiphilus sp. PB12-B1b]QMU77902.1 PadR family transcriptional regulator [Streptacidiphilus sp. PB12-B1b]
MRHQLLALLARQPAYGYELKQALEQTFGAAYPEPNIGQIYVTLGRLEKGGLVLSQEVAQSGKPDKRVYEITESGTTELVSWITSPTEGPRVRDEFFMKLILAPGTALTDRLTLINNQRRHCLTMMRGLNRLASQERDNRVSQLLIEGAVLHLQADLDWLERCQEELT